MKIFKHILNYRNFILLTSFVSATLLSFGVISPAIADVKQNIDTQTSCSKTFFPDNVERDVVIDSDGGLIYVVYEENGLKKEAIFSLKKDSRISGCNKGVKEIIELSQNITDKINSDTCKEVNDLISETEISLTDGRKIDMKSANNYINHHCK